MGCIDHQMILCILLIFGMIPYQISVQSKPNMRKGRTLKLTATLWQLTYTGREWCLRIVGLQLLNRRCIDDLSG